MQINGSARKAIKLGSLCAVAYWVVYISRNILSAATPKMINSGLFTAESIGTLSSLFFISYACGQLINGVIGDRLKAKYMIGGGLVLAGVCNVLFCSVVHSDVSRMIIYALSGFFLSMIYGPMTKVVSENVELKYATRCSLAYTFSSFFGSPTAGLMAVWLLWAGVFFLGGAMLIITGVVSFLLLSYFEHKGEIKQLLQNRDKVGTKAVKVLIKNDIIRFTLVSALTGIVRTAVVFWMPTYFSQYLGFSASRSAFIFTISSLAISFSAFIAIFIYERLNYNMNLTLVLSFLLSSVCFGMMIFAKGVVMNIVFITLAVIFANCASTMLWSIYCPSLSRTGMVSSATGFLDFISYMAAAVSSSVFANAVDSIGWKNLIIVWLLIMVAGVVVALPWGKAKS